MPHHTGLHGEVAGLVRVGREAGRARGKCGQEPSLGFCEKEWVRQG